MNPAVTTAQPLLEGHRFSGWRRIALTMLPWLIISLVFLPSALLLDRDAVRPLGWRYLGMEYLICFMVWAPYTVLIGRVLRKQSMRWPPTLQASLAHMGLAATLTLLHVLFMAAFACIVPSDRPFVAYSQNVVRQWIELGPMDVVLYTGIVACLTAWNALTRYHERERTIVQARLDALRARIEPHFLFNTLNALSELVYRDPEAADRAITQLARLLRHVIDRDAHEQSLGDELSMLREYAAIQKILLGERLDFRCDIADALQLAQVPTLLLQPLFENAIRHGIAQMRSGGIVELKVSADHDTLRLVLRNDGPASRATVPGGGVGLANTRARLHALYGSDQRMTLTFPPAGGAEVVIELPLHTQAGRQ